MLDIIIIKAVKLTFLKHFKVNAKIFYNQLINNQIFAAFNFQNRKLI